MGLNTHMTAGENGTAVKMSRYQLDTQGKTDRVLFVFGINLVSDPTDPVAAANEILIYKGRDFDCIPTRLSIPRAEGVTLTEEDWKRMAEKFSERYLMGRPGVFVVHGDSAGSIHMHGLSAFLDPNGHPLNFGGKGAFKEGLRRQEIADELSVELGLTPTPREEGKCAQAKNREGIEAKRMREPKDSNGKPLSPKPRWLDRLKSCVLSASDKAKTREQYIQLMALQNITAKYRGKDIVYTLNEGGKQYRCRGKRLGTDYQAALLLPSDGTGGGIPPMMSPTLETSVKPTAATGSAGKPAGSGGTGGGIAGGGGVKLSEDERWRLGEDADAVEAALQDAQQAVSSGAAEVTRQDGRK